MESFLVVIERGRGNMGGLLAGQGGWELCLLELTLRGGRVECRGRKRNIEGGVGEKVIEGRGLTWLESRFVRGPFRGVVSD